MSQVSANEKYEFCNDPTFAANQCYIYFVYTFNEVYAPEQDEINSSVIFTNDYLVWKAKKRVHFVKL